MVKENSLSVRKIIKLFNQWTLKKNGSGSKSEYDNEIVGVVYSDIQWNKNKFKLT